MNTTETTRQHTDRAWWVSWISDGAAFEYPGPWWHTGTELTGHLDNPTARPIFCAAVMAPDADAARQVIIDAHDEPPAKLEWRFADEKGADWAPFCDRFPRAEWMAWPCWT